MIQIESIDDRLRTGLWNVFVYYIPQLQNKDFILKRIYATFFCLPLDTFPREPQLPDDTYMRGLLQEQYKKDVAKYLESLDELVSNMKHLFDQLQWFEVYNFIEFVVNEIKDEQIYENFTDSSNSVLERE